MIPRAAFVLLAGLTLPTARALLVQDPDPEQEPPKKEGSEEGERESLERDLFGRVRTKPGRSHPFLGAWQLVALEAKGYPSQGMEPNGFLLVADDFLAFEMHVSWDPNVAGEELIEGFQTFMAEYSLLGGAVLRCRTLIGSYLEEEDDELEWEPAGMGREFLMELKGGFLTLTWDQTDSMTFARRKAGGGGGENIFGRATNLPTVRKGADIFGRESKKRAEGGTGGDR